MSREHLIDTIQLVPVYNKTVIKSEMPFLDTSNRYLVIDDIYDIGYKFHKVTRALTGFNCNFAFCIRYKSYGITAEVLGHNK